MTSHTWTEGEGNKGDPSVSDLRIGRQRCHLLRESEDDLALNVEKWVWSLGGGGSGDIDRELVASQ